MDSINDRFYEMALRFWYHEYIPEDFLADVNSLFEEAWEIGHEEAFREYVDYMESVGDEE